MQKLAASGLSRWQAPQRIGRQGYSIPMPPNAAGRKVEFFYDYGSPYSYLANSQLPGICEELGAELVYRPMLLGGVFKATGNRSPAQESVEAKRRYGGTTMQRWVDHYGVRFGGNPHFPINTLELMRRAVAAQHEGVFAAYHAAVYPAFWDRGLDLGDAELRDTLLAESGLDPERLGAIAASPEAKGELRATTEEAVARGAFGAPTVFVGEAMFFGADHLPFLRQELEK